MKPEGRGNLRKLGRVGVSHGSFSVEKAIQSSRGSDRLRRAGRSSLTTVNFACRAIAVMLGEWMALDWAAAGKKDAALRSWMVSEDGVCKSGDRSGPASSQRLRIGAQRCQRLVGPVDLGGGSAKIAAAVRQAECEAIDPCEGMSRLRALRAVVSAKAEHGHLVIHVVVVVGL